jgi:hypothetical protein
MKKRTIKNIWIDFWYEKHYSYHYYGGEKLIGGPPAEYSGKTLKTQKVFNTILIIILCIILLCK